MSVFIDTSIVMYAGGARHRHREPCRRVLQQVVAGDLDGVTSTEVVQEILHRFAAGDHSVGVRMAHATMDLFGDLLPIDQASMQDAVERYARHPELSARDALHVATCVVYGIREIVTVDTDFDRAPNVVRVDPHDLGGG